jgi:hypothetical protein
MLNLSKERFMQREAMVRVADEIVMMAYLEKVAGIDLKKHYKEINKAFTDYITTRTFTLGNKKVPYLELPPKDRERVWSEFWNYVAREYDVEKQVDDVIEKMKTLPAVSRG